MIKEAIKKVADRIDLEESEAVQVMEEIMSGEATPAQIAAFITALRMKGETVDEIVGAARVMRAKAARVPGEDGEGHGGNDHKTLVDTCGTGGDGTMTFNISTTAAFVVAGGGIKVAKHGNRSVSSSCGSADVLEKLGINIEASPEKVGQYIDRVGIGFLFAPVFHSSMRYAIGPRKEVGLRTIFNVLGPLTNPAGARYQLVGVYDEALCEPLAQVLGRLGAERAMVVHGLDGMDEISVTGETKVSEMVDDEVRTYFVRPGDFGLKQYDMKELQGGNAEENARILEGVLSGKANGAKRAVVALNAGAAFYVSGGFKDIKEGVRYAEQVIDSGKALAKLRELVGACRA
ncbi:anthranilate phosphoribosyltransferase [Syntrophorhabdus aromaticivorans]|uniref:anthranilate phosphoribosyltransferase n=1 Tax=Syntrophorhabdus aromaticivorans TaxID=328301 RepID=UPI00042123ED|nr:anthranilate phosphoribosyltransferase [Syntrophorhabdus aromaticivorans]HBA55474.1 anthranilate phosphoribosyltransferase [Syntrophorhabdus aromaticivorans]